MTTKGGEALHTSTSFTKDQAELVDAVYKFCTEIEKAEDKTALAGEYESLLTAAQGVTAGNVRAFTASRLAKYSNSVFPSSVGRVVGLFIEGLRNKETHAAAIKGLTEVAFTAETADDTFAKLLSAVSDFSHEGFVEEQYLKVLAKINAAKSQVGTISTSLAPKLKAAEKQSAAHALLFAIVKTITIDSASQISGNKELELQTRKEFDSIIGLLSVEQVKAVANFLSVLPSFKRGAEPGLQSVFDLVFGATSFSEEAAEEQVHDACQLWDYSIKLLSEGCVDTKINSQLFGLLEVFESIHEDLKREILHLMCKICKYASEEVSDSVADAVKFLYTLITPKAVEGSDVPEIFLEYLESILFVLHCFAIKFPKLLVKETGIAISDIEGSNAEKFGELKEKLESVQAAVEKVHSANTEALAAVGRLPKNQENLKAKSELARGERATHNVVLLIKGLLSGSFTQAVQFSWDVAPTERAAGKREGNGAQPAGKRRRVASQHYQPPARKQ